jgi:hypothetical protein
MLTVPVDNNNEFIENPTQNNEDTDGVIPFDLKGTYCIFASVSTIFRFDFGIIPTVWYFLVSILSHAVQIHI